MPPKKIPKKLNLKNNLSSMSLNELKNLLEEYNIDSRSIKGTGKGNRVIKNDYIREIEDYETKMSKKGKIKVPSPKKKKSIKIVFEEESPKKSTKKQSKNKKITVHQALDELRTYDKYKNLSDYVIKAKIGNGKASSVRAIDIQEELRRMREGGSEAEEKPSLRKSIKKGTSTKKTSLKKSFQGSTGEESETSFEEVDKIKLNCVDREKYKNKYCDTRTGKIIAKNKDGRPRGEKKLMEDKDYYINEEYGIVGTKEEIAAHIAHWKGKESEEIESPKKKIKKTKVKFAAKPKAPIKSKLCGSSDMTSFEDFTKCDKDTVCDVMSGYCVENNDINKSGKVVMDVKGQTLIGSSDVMDKLKGILGGTIISEEKLPTLTKTTKKTEEKPVKKTTEEKSTTKGGVLVSSAREEIYREFTECLNKGAQIANKLV
jgi:hypothetical protein